VGTSFVHHFALVTLLEDSGVGGGGAGLQKHPQKFLFGENPGKIHLNLCKICGYLGKICKNLRKITENLGKLPENRGKNGPHCAFI